MSTLLITPRLITQRYKAFMSKRKTAEERYSSFDLCYSYFINNKGNLVGANMETSCLQLWAFLSSWGMVARGNALQGKSYASLKDVIQFINNNPQFYLSKIDSNNYVDEMAALYLGIKKALNLTQASQKTIITKIMLGVYACIPAFDQYVCETLRTSTIGDLSQRNIQSIVSLYNNHKQQIDSLAATTPVISFNGIYINGLHYSPAKIIDMITFTRP